jgi:hypothetical protein
MTLRNAMAMALLLGTIAAAQGNQGPRGAYLAGDFHQHTYYTDGSNTFARVMAENAIWRLDWWANSEHGGERNRDGNGNFWDDPTFYPVNPILGDVEMSGGHQEMWRWQSLRDYVWPELLGYRSMYPTKIIVSGLEWNVPGHEHCSTAIHQYDNSATAISEFEFRFDRSDDDTSRNGENGLLGDKLSKENNSKAGAIAAVKWMQAMRDKKIGDAWIVPAHVERAKSYWIEDFGNWQDAGPDVAFGMEGLPGHQTSGDRGFSRGSLGGGTYGGAGFFVAKLGGLWDGMLAEGRKFYNFASSDYHRHWSEGGSDFWPGEYQKQYTWIDLSKLDRVQAVFDGNRSGNSWHVEGDLIDELHFNVRVPGTRRRATMGQTLTVTKGEWVTVTIRLHDPEGANNCPLNLPNLSLALAGRLQPLWLPSLDHVDVIGASITGKVPSTNTKDPAATDYGTDAKVVRRFDTSTIERSNGYIVLTYAFIPQNDMYLRLRGTNLPPNTPLETDAAGEPLADSVANDAFYGNLPNNILELFLFPHLPKPATNSKLDEVAEAYADLWFYSNPLFIKVEAKK